MIADGDGRKLSWAHNPEPASSVRTENSAPVRPIRMTQIREPSGLQLRSNRAKQIRGRGVHRKLESGLVQRVFHGRRAHQRIPDMNLTHRSRGNHAIQTAKTSRRIPWNGFGIDDARCSTRLRRDKKLGRGNPVELADDAVAGGAGQADRRYEGSEPNGNA